MPVVRIAETTMERLKAVAVPLQDTVDDVVNRALDALGGVAKNQDIKPPATKIEGTKLPQKEFRAPLLKLMNDLGGRASTKTIRERLEPRIASRLTPADYELVSSGEQRWWNAVCWERNELKKEGIFRNDSDHGFWELVVPTRFFSCP